MLSLLLSKFGGYLAAGLAFVAAIAGIYFKGKSSGKQAEQAKETETALKQAKEANAIDDKVHAMPQSELDSELRRDQRD